MSAASLPVIKLSDDFLKVLNLDAKSAHTLSPVFAARVDRLTSTGSWVPRAVLLNKEGILRIFECGSGRITHALDVASVNEFSPIELDAPAAKLRSYRDLRLTVGEATLTNSSNNSSADSLSSQCVRIVGTCKAKLSLDDRLIRHEQGLGDAVTFEDDVLLRFVTTSQLPLGLQFVAALKYFGAARDPASSFGIQRSSTSLEAICSAKYKSAFKAAHTEGDAPAGDADTAGRRKPNRLASSISVFKKEISTIKALASRTTSEIVTAGGVLEEPPSVSPRAIGTVEKDEPVVDALVSDDVATNVGAGSDTAPPTTVSLDDGDALMRLLTRPKLTTIPLSTQRSLWAPRYVEELLHRLAPELISKRAVTTEVCSRWRLLAHYAELLEMNRADRVCLYEKQTEWLRVMLDDVVTPYTVSKLQAMHLAFQSLHLPLPEFDRRAFDEVMLEALYERDSLEEINDTLNLDVEQSRKELQSELLEDPEEVRQEEESVEVIERLRSLQISLKHHQMTLHERTQLEIERKQESCLQTLGKQEIEIERLRAHLQRLKSIFVLRDELMHDVTPQPTGPTCESMGVTGRRVRMMNDV
jgi:hypothetical protein